MPVARMLSAVLGPDHVVTKMVQDAAEANMSPATRSALQERERIRQVPPLCCHHRGIELLL